MTWSGECCFLKGNWSLTLNAPQSPHGIFERLQQPKLLGLHPRCQEAKANGIHEPYIPEHLHFGLLAVVCSQKEKHFCFSKL